VGANIVHRIPPLWSDCDGQAFSINGNGNFRLTETASVGYVGSCESFPTLAFRPVTSFGKPARQGGLSPFLRRLLLGGFPPVLNQLQQHLAAITQTLAFLKFINEGDSLARQIDDKLMPSVGHEPTAVSAVSVAQRVGGSHETSATNYC
jgi:hypothetical protein